LILLVFITDYANLSVARIEAEDALEAAALAAVKQWQDQGNTSSHRMQARRAAVSYAAANTILGRQVGLLPNQSQGGGGDVNDNASPIGNIVLGTIRLHRGRLHFDPSTAPGPDGFGVRVQAVIPVRSLWGALGSNTFGPYEVSVHATALKRNGSDPQLVRAF
jgi:hypothetical protein